MYDMADLQLDDMLSPINGNERNKHNENLRKIEAKYNEAKATASQAVSESTDALVKSTDALAKSTAADIKSDATAQQLETIVIENGTSDAETLAARTDGNTAQYFPTLGKRLDSHATQLADTALKSEARLKVEKLALEDMSAETLSAIQGGEGTSFNLLSVPQNESVAPIKTDFVSIGKNIVDSQKFITGVSLNYTNGAEATVSSRTASPFVYILPDTLYTQSHSAVTVFYDKDKNFISSLQEVAPFTPRTFTTPTNAQYIRTAVALTDLPMYQIESGITATSYESYRVKINKLYTPDYSVSRTKQIAPFVTMLGTIQITIDWATKKITVPVASFYYDHVAITSVGAVTLDLPVGAVSYLYIDTLTKEVKVASKSPNLANILIIAELFVTASICSIYTLSRSAIKLINYTATILQHINGKEIIAGTMPETVLDSATLTKINQIARTSKIYTFNDAWAAWINGEKFPIAFTGDSTSDGNNTSGFVANVLGQDSTSPNAYSKKLEGLLRTITGSTTLRIYNAGFSGKTAQWAVGNFDAMFKGTSAYSDVKMIGISYGINDRVIYPTEKEFRTGFKSDVELLISKCLLNNIQPFLLTTQAVLSPGVRTDYVTPYPLRDAQRAETIANEVKKELAVKHGLDVIDVNDFTEKFMLYSQYTLSQIISDKIHFGDIGHKYEAEMFFSHICPYPNFVQNRTKIDFTSQKLFKGVPEDWVDASASFTGEFKTNVNREKGNTIDTLLMSVYVFIDDNRKMTLKAYKSDISSLTYLKVNGIITQLDTLEKTIGDLDLGLHLIEVWSGTHNKADFKGIVIE
jgi:hypothetical protein